VCAAVSNSVSCGLLIFRQIGQRADVRGRRHQFEQQSQPFCHRLSSDQRDAGDVTARPVEAGDQPERDRVAADHEHDRNRRGRRFGRADRRGAGGRDDGGDPPVDQIGRQCRQPIVLAVRVAVFDRHVAAFGMTGFAQAFAECGEEMGELGRRGAVQISNHRHRLLRARRERPSRRAAEQSDELWPLQVEHGDFLPSGPQAADWARALSLPHLQPAAGRPASPWGRPELF
jgi:hypothetical protein